MRWYEEITQAVKVKSIIISTVTFICGLLGLYYFILRPNENLAQVSIEKFNDLNESYLQLKSTDINKVEELLQAEAENLRKKEEVIDSQSLSYEYLFLLISKFEDEANKTGIECEISILDEVNDQVENKKNVSIELSFEGSFQQVIKFIKKLQTWDEVLFVNDFHIQKKNKTDSKLTGQIIFMSFLSDI